MQTLRPYRMHLHTSLMTAVGMAFAASAWASPDTKTAGSCTPPHTEEATEAALIGPIPDPALDAPVLSGFSGAARFRDGDTRPMESPLGWLIANSGPKGGIRLSAERMARSPEKKPSVSTESPKTSKEPAAKRGGKRRGGESGHIAKPHRMPSLEIL